MTDAPPASDPVAAAQALLKAGKLAEAWKAATAACQAAPAEPRAWLARADIARAAGDLDALALALEKAIPLVANLEIKQRLALDRAWALAHTGRRAAALEVTRKVLPQLATVQGRRLAGRVLDALGLQTRDPGTTSAWRAGRWARTRRRRKRSSGR
jgi:tetratricopeptide (TPR) repeat protein